MLSLSYPPTLSHSPSPSLPHRSDLVARTQVLCVPPHTRLQHYPSYRNAHSDTEHTSKVSSGHVHYHSILTCALPHQPHHSNGPVAHYSSNKALSQHQFYDILYERLLSVQSSRVELKRRASNIAREAGKSYEEIMVSG